MTTAHDNSHWPYHFPSATLNNCNKLRKLAPSPFLAPDIPANWATRVNQAQTAREESEIEISIERSRPLGNAAWQQRMAETLGLTSCFRNPGRPATEKPRKS